MRLRFWLAVMDMIEWCGGFGTRLYSWATVHAMDEAYRGYEHEPVESEPGEVEW